MLLLFYQSTSPLSRLIRFVTRSPYSHVGVMARGSVYEALARGLVRVDGKAASKRLTQATAYRHVPALDPVLEKRAISWLDQRVGGGYSILGFLAAGIGAITGWRVVVALRGEYICSGLVASALQMCGYDFEEPRLETPASLAVTFMPRPIKGQVAPDDEMVENAARRLTVGA